MNTQNPLIHLAQQIHHNKGTYAVLLGSGISQAAGLPTAWNIIHDLLVKLATLQGLEPPHEDDDLSAWYEQHFKQPLTYSDLVHSLAPTPALQQRLLEPYFEPTPEERQDGKKQPTDAHRALARLCLGKYIRVILTTNFDQLMEQALREVGLNPIVLSSPSDLPETDSLHHQDLFIIKLHGDYRMTNVRNSHLDLELYPREWNDLLTEVLHNYGLIVCGWSGESDLALRNAILNSPARRFPLYWVNYRSPKENSIAEQVVQHRQGHLLYPYSADAFFTELESKVYALHNLNHTPPVALSALTEELKRILDGGSAIRLQDFLERETLAFLNAFRDHTEYWDSFRPKSPEAAAHALEHAENTAARIGVLGVTLAKHDHKDALQHFKAHMLDLLPQLWRDTFQARHTLKGYALCTVLHMWFTGFTRYRRWDYIQVLQHANYKIYQSWDREHLVYASRSAAREAQEAISMLSKNRSAVVNARILQETEQVLSSLIPSDLRTSFMLGELLINFICEDSNQHFRSSCYMFDKFAGRYEEQPLMRDWLQEQSSKFMALYGDKLPSLAAAVQKTSQNAYAADEGSGQGFISEISECVTASLAEK